MEKENKTVKSRFDNLPKSERFVMHQEDENIAKVESLARMRGVTKSWIIRSILRALEKKFVRGLPEKYKINRPKKFKKKFRKITVCFYGDRQKWFSLCRIWEVELGPLIRFGLALYESGELDLDLESESTVKEVKFSNRGTNIKQKKRNSVIRKSRYIYRYQNISVCYDKWEFWHKNPEGNHELMELGLRNRIYPLKLPKNFQIPKCFRA